MHKLPSLVDNKKTLTLIGANDIPDMVQDDIHGNRTKFVFEVADIKDNHGIIYVNIRLLREDASEGSSGVFSEALGERRTGSFHMN